MKRIVSTITKPKTLSVPGERTTTKTDRDVRAILFELRARLRWARVKSTQVGGDEQARWLVVISNLETKIATLSKPVNTLADYEAYAAL